MKELENQYDGLELERLQRKHKFQLSTERYKRANEGLKRTLETLTSQLQRLIHLENEKEVKGTMKVEHIEGTNTEIS